MENKSNKVYSNLLMKLSFILKILSFIVLPILLFFQGRVGKRFIFQIFFDVVFIFFTTVLLFTFSQKKRITYIYNSILCLIVHFQVLILYYANSYITLAMLTNVDSLKAQSGHAFLYCCLVIIFIFISLLPIYNFNISNKKKYCFLITLFILFLCNIKLNHFSNSPFISFINLPKDYIRHQRLLFTKKVEKKKSRFYKNVINDYFTMENPLPEKPNIILIFTEGLSENIIYDPRNIMSNVNDFSGKSIVFENYYNHTFATYRGIIGQLYSGYQQENFDENSLISLQSILKKNGYNTYFINTEPNNQDFTLYLRNMMFDKVISNKENTKGISKSVSDADAYSLLFEECKQASSSNNPFFMCIYTFGTHASFDGINYQFGDGKNPLLNKFYDLDNQFGVFFEKFINSNLLDDTILVFTTDHATYNDYDFTSAFPKYQRIAPDCDKIPLFVYYKNCKHQIVDVEGSNSINLCPTILDILDISDENYFIGDSLFNPNKTNLEKQFHCLSTYYKTDSLGIHKLNKKEINDFENQLAEYFTIKRYYNKNVSKFEECYATAYEIDNNSSIILNVYNAKGTQFKIACWSDANNQSDIRWFDFSTHIESKINTFNIPLEGFSYNGVYDIHVYSVIDDKDVFQTWTTCIVRF